MVSSDDQPSAYFSSGRLRNRLGPVAVGQTESSKERRGLITTRPVRQGEMLLVSNPIASASIGETFKRFRALQQGEGHNSFEQLAEEVLLENLERLTTESTDAVDIVMAMADGDRADLPLPDLGVMHQDREALVLKGGQSLGLGRLRKVISANANGPDFRQYAQIAEDWRRAGDPGRYSRLMGLYVVPSLANHACVANACRVFKGETMIVRATRDLAEGEEVLVPYSPPFQTLRRRQEHLREAFGFTCACARCKAEEALGPEYAGLQDDVTAALEGQGEGEVQKWVDRVEETLGGVKDSQVRRWARASFLPLYFAYFNTVGLEGAAEQVAKLQTELHLSLMSVNNASTEHLSLLHACYEGAGLRHGVNSARSRFWVGQLQMAHHCRYGPVEGTDMLRLLKHTKTVLRERDGFHKAQWDFL